MSRQGAKAPSREVPKETKRFFFASLCALVPLCGEEAGYFFTPSWRGAVVLSAPSQRPIGRLADTHENTKEATNVHVVRKTATPPSPLPPGSHDIVDNKGPGKTRAVYPTMCMMVSELGRRQHKALFYFQQDRLWKKWE